MTTIQQHLITENQARGRNEGEPSHARLQAINNSTGEPGSSTVNISWQAVMRLSAFEQQKIQDKDRITAKTELLKPGAAQDSERSALTEQLQSNFTEGNLSVLPDNIAGMLSEIEQNLVQTTEPGYKHLRNLLSNQSNTLSEPEQLQEIIRREKYFLGRRKAFMDSSEFQSYSQVLNQFSNILQRELVF